MWRVRGNMMRILRMTTRQNMTYSKPKMTPSPLISKPTSSRKGSLLGLTAIATCLGLSGAAAVYCTAGTSATEAEELYLTKKYNRRDLYHYLQQAVLVEPNDVELLWRMARAQYDVAQLSSTTTMDKKELIYDAQKTILSAMEVHKDHFAVQKW